MKIALIGFGLEAKSAYEYFKKLNKNYTFDIYDENSKSKIELPEGVNFFGNFHDFSKIKADLIVRTPAVNPNRLLQNTKITSVTNLFFENCPVPIIGVTGSKGKGTVSSFIAEILRAAKIKTHLVGNIGVPALNHLSEIQDSDVVVYELSSFQLWDTQKSPHISILNNIEPDHLDVHNDFKDYISAKINIAKNQKKGDFFIFNQEDEIVSKTVKSEKQNLKAELQPFPNFDLAHIEEGKFFWGDELIFSTNILKIPGVHNQKNACAAMIATFDFLREKGFEIEEIFDFWREGLSKFTGLPHRLKFVREVGGVKFYDDSIATTPGSAIAALNSFVQPKVLILGGSDKGADLSELISKISKMSENELRKVILMGAEAEKLVQKLTDVNFERFINLGAKTDMAEAVKAAFENAKSGDVVILSPAHASFDMFKSYVDRGEQFIENVNLYDKIGVMSKKETKIKKIAKTEVVKKATTKLKKVDPKAHFKGFKKFIKDQGLIGMAIGLILGTASGELVKSLINNVIMPPLGFVLGSSEGLKGIVWNMGKTPAGKDAVLYYGAFLNDIVNFLVIAFVVYFVLLFVEKLFTDDDIEEEAKNIEEEAEKAAKK